MKVWFRCCYGLRFGFDIQRLSFLFLMTNHKFFRSFLLMCEKFSEHFYQCVVIFQGFYCDKQ